MTEIEKKAVLALKSYFSKDPVVVDIGSNKGEWADSVINNVEKMLLIEPNARLLTYTQVKYDHLKNVSYSNIAMSDYNGEAEFSYFTDTHNGLSNIIGNTRWDYLNPQKIKVQTCSIDYLTWFEEDVDFVKIDVEGAEMLVLKGAQNALKNKSIKFIQIEKSEHYDFYPLPSFIRQFGYDLFHFDGTNFIKYTNQDAENLYIMDKDFTQDWNTEFKRNTEGIKVDFSLEIGCFEGLTTTYICDNLLNPGGRIICVDPLTDEYLPGHEDNEMFKGQYERFIRNTRTYPVELKRMTSNEAFKLEGFEHYRFGLIYIDGDHRRDQVYEDGKQCVKICKLGGYILFDDYEWRQETKEGIDKFLNEFGGYFQIIHKGYQVLLKKIK